MATLASADSEISPLSTAPRPDETEAEAERRHELIRRRTRASTAADRNAEPHAELPEPPLDLSPDGPSVMGHPVKSLRRGLRFDWTLKQKVLITNFIIINGFSKEQCGQNKKEQVSSQQLKPLLVQLDFTRFTSMKNDSGDLIGDIIEEKLRTRLWKSHEGKGNVDKIHRDAILKGELLALENVNGDVVAVPIGSAGSLHRDPLIPPRSQPSQPPQTQNVNQIPDWRLHPTINSIVPTNSSTNPTNSTTVPETSAPEIPPFSDPFAHLSIEEKYQMRQEYMQKWDEQLREKQNREQIRNPSTGMQPNQLQSQSAQYPTRAATGVMPRIPEEEEVPSSSFISRIAKVIGVGVGSGLSTSVHGPRQSGTPATAFPQNNSLGLEHQSHDRLNRQSSPSQRFEGLSIHDTSTGSLTGYREPQQTQRVQEQHQSSVCHTQPLNVTQVPPQTQNHSTRQFNSLDGTTTSIPSYIHSTDISGALRDLQPPPQGFRDRQNPPPTSHRYGYNSSPALQQSVNGNPSATPQGHSNVNPSATPQHYGNANDSVPQYYSTVNPPVVPRGYNGFDHLPVPQHYGNANNAIPQGHSNVNPSATPQHYGNANNSVPQYHSNVNPPVVPQGYNGFDHLAVPQHGQGNYQYPGHKPHVLPYGANSCAAPQFGIHPTATQYGAPPVPQQHNGFNPSAAPQHRGGVDPSGVPGYYGSSSPIVPQHPGYNPYGVNPHQNFNHSGMNTPPASPANFPTSIHAFQKTYKHDYARDKAALEDYRRNLMRKERDRKFKFVEEVVREARNDDDAF